MPLVIAGIGLLGLIAGAIWSHSSAKKASDGLNGTIPNYEYQMERYPTVPNYDWQMNRRGILVPQVPRVPAPPGTWEPNYEFQMERYQPPAPAPSPSTLPNMADWRMDQG